MHNTYACPEGGPRKAGFEAWAFDQADAEDPYPYLVTLTLRRRDRETFEELDARAGAALSQTLEALNLSKAANAAAEEKEEKKSGGLFSRFRK